MFRRDVLHCKTIPHAIVGPMVEEKELSFRCSSTMISFKRNIFRGDFRFDWTHRLTAGVHFHVRRERAFILCKAGRARDRWMTV